MASGDPLLKNDGLVGAAAVLGVLKEDAREKRCAMSPDTAKMIIADGYVLNIEKGTGIGASFTDAAFEAVGCKVMSRTEVIQKSQVLFRIDAPVNEFQQMGGKIVVSWVGRLLETGKEIVKKAASARVTLIDVTAVPRITIAQKLDTLSSQAKVAGHRAVLEAAGSFGRFHQAEMTAAGKFPPSHTFVLGCGVAGLAAIGTSRALGSIVRAWDVRDVHDQVESMGAKWVKVDFKEDASGGGGYAKESSQEFLQAQRDTFLKHLKECDIAITTAAIPGRPSPLLITEDMVANMKPGSVIVDLAAVGGGNCALTKKDELILTPNGVTIIGYTDLAARMSAQSSAMYAQNMMQMLKHIHGKEKAAGFINHLHEHLANGEEGDIVSRSIVTCKDGKLLDMPKLPQVGPGKPTAKPVAKPTKPEKTRGEHARDAWCTAIFISILFLLFLEMSLSAPVTVIRSFLLAGTAGYQAVWGVAHALHTPLMSVTNAISGMTVIGGIVIVANDTKGKLTSVPMILGYLSACVSTINIVGGFIVTQRMLNLFKRKGDIDNSATLFLPGAVLIAYSLMHPFTDGIPQIFDKDVAPGVNGTGVGGGISVAANGEEVVCTLASCLCIAAIMCLATQKTANMGCKFGIVGVVAAVATTLRGFMHFGDTASTILYGLMVLGAVLGCCIGASVSPIKLPQTVAGFHSLVGLAAMTTSIAAFHNKPEAGFTVENISSLLGNFIGGVTLTGSLIAFGKLNANLSSKELKLPGKNFLNLFGFFLFVGLSVYLCLKGDHDDGKVGQNVHWAVAGLSCLMGLHLVASVGGGDMPVCVTVLNSYSGWALAAEGFNLQIPMLAVVGSLIGFSGAILTKIMCDAMNRDIMNVIFGGMNVAPPAKKGDEAPKVHVEATVTSVADMIASSKEVAIVPGYGMAVARAQNAVGEVATVLRNNGINCTFVIHPVAGRMPGQMNVLLAEAGVPYDWVKEMDEVNPDMEKMDLVLVMGANDITNSAAQEVEGCSIWGMPVIEVWRSKKVIFCKRSMGGGYADLENPVFFKENTNMLLGDAKKTAESLSTEVKKILESA